MAESITTSVLHTGYNAPDNMGRHFILGYMVNINIGNRPMIDVELYVSTSSPTEVSVRVTAPVFQPGLLDERFTVRGGQFHLFCNKLRVSQCLQGQYCIKLPCMF